MNSNNSHFVKIQLLLILIIIFLIPLSRNGESSALFGAFGGLLLLAVVFMLLLTNTIELRRLAMGIVLIVYLAFATIETIAGGDSSFYFGYIRCINIVTVLLLFSFKIDSDISAAFFSRALDVMVLFIVVGNILVLLNVADLRDLMVSFYTQYLSKITAYQISTHKPILVFGVHNIAAFVYQGLLLLSLFTYEHTKEKKYLAYILIFLALLLALRCTTSIGYAAFSIAVIVYYQTKSIKKLLVAFAILLIAVGACFYLGLTDYFLSIFSQQSNGIIPRYLSGMQDLYGGNIAVIKASAFGTGFCISDGANGVYGADSGYIITYTIGKLIYFAVFYALFWFFLRSNLSTKKAIIVAAYIALMELGFVTFLYYKSIALITFIVYYTSSLEKTLRI